MGLVGVMKEVGVSASHVIVASCLLFSPAIVLALGCGLD
jgi:hypothetical protein